MASGSNAQPDAQIPPSLPDDVEQEESSSATDDEDVEEILFAQKKYLGISLIVYTCAVLFPPPRVLHLLDRKKTKKKDKWLKQKKK